MRGFGICRGAGEGKHISLAAIFEGKHISLVICVRGHTYHGETHITVTQVPIFLETARRTTMASPTDNAPLRGALAAPYILYIGCRSHYRCQLRIGS